MPGFFLSAVQANLARLSAAPAFARDHLLPLMPVFLARYPAVLPDWHVDAGPISLYFASQRLLPAKTRAFVDFVIQAFEQGQLALRFAADRAQHAANPRHHAAG